MNFQGDIVVDYQKNRETRVWSLNMQSLFMAILYIFSNINLQFQNHTPCNIGNLTVAYIQEPA